MDCASPGGWLKRLRRCALLVLLSSELGAPVALVAQSVNTATIRGTVRPVDARIRVLNIATGFSTEVEARNGEFTVHGLEVGGPYVLLARRIGYTAKEISGLYLTLSKPLEVNLSLSSLSTLETVRVVARNGTGGTGTIADSLLHRLPTLNRDMYDFARLAPQISTKVALGIGGLSGSGVNARFNNFLVDGVPNRFASGNTAMRSVPLDAVKEYEVVLAPFDVRFGDFAGALVNAVTRAGTNEVHASGFGFFRNEQWARAIDEIRDAPYQRAQAGFVVSGPLVRDHVQLLVAPEFQRLTSPAQGPFLGQSPGVFPAVPVAPADVARFAGIMSGYGLEAGSGGSVSTGNPATNLFVRLDVALPALNSRAVVLGGYVRSDNVIFSRASADTFTLSSYRWTQALTTKSISAQVHTNLPHGRYNSLTVSYRPVATENRPDARGPIVLVSVPNTRGGVGILKAGSQEQTHGVSGRQSSVVVTNNLTLPLGAKHDIVVGGQLELIRLGRRGVNGSYGTWAFSSLDSLAAGLAEHYQVRQDFGTANLGMRAAQYALYAGDEWRTSDRFSVTVGLRGDAFALMSHAPYNRDVDSIFGRRTDHMPETRFFLSPRVGFTWDAFGVGRDRIRGGVGVFTGRFSPAWAQTAVHSYGSGVGSLQCGTLATDYGRVPAFVPDYRAAPSACANGRTLTEAPKGDVDLLDRRLRLAQTVRGVLGYDRRLPWDVTLSGEAMITRNISDFIFVNLNLKGPQSVDQHGRVMYGKVAATGVADPARVSGFNEVIDLRNVSANRAFQVDTRLEKRFSHRGAATASYTFTSVRDVQLPLRSGMPGNVNWSSGRVVSGRHEDLEAGVSLFDLPHRVVVAGTISAPWWRATADFSLYYVGESGSPFTYVAGGAGRRGDLNADGAVGNDPLYIPTSTRDPNEIQFSGVSSAPGADNTESAQASRVAAQQDAFDAFIGRTRCLRRQRGRIMERNSCREPWSHTSIASIRQAVPVGGTHAVTVHVDIFNVLNVLSGRWGAYRVASPVLLSQVGETTGSTGIGQPVFLFDPTRPQWTTLATESAYQLQVGVRYSF
jgi:hypothetical protein